MGSRRRSRPSMGPVEYSTQPSVVSRPVRTATMCPKRRRAQRLCGARIDDFELRLCPHRHAPEGDLDSLGQERLEERGVRPAPARGPSRSSASARSCLRAHRARSPHRGSCRPAWPTRSTRRASPEAAGGLQSPLPVCAQVSQEAPCACAAENDSKPCVRIASLSKTSLPFESSVEACATDACRPSAATTAAQSAHT